MRIVYIANILLLFCNAVLLIRNSHALKEADVILKIAECYKNDCAAEWAKAKLVANAEIVKSDNML